MDFEIYHYGKQFIIILKPAVHNNHYHFRGKGGTIWFPGTGEWNGNVTDYGAAIVLIES